MRIFLGIIVWLALSFYFVWYLHWSILAALIAVTLVRLSLHRGHVNDELKLKADIEAIRRGEAASKSFYFFKYLDLGLMVAWLTTGPGLLMMLLEAMGFGAGGAERCVARGPCY